MADVKWIKLNTDIFEDDKMCMLETCEKGIAYELIWIKILCLAGKCNQNGYLMLGNGVSYDTKTIAKIFRLDIKLVEWALNKFIELGMMELHEETYMVSNWLLHQNEKGLEELREQSRARQKKYRENQKKKASNVTSDVTDNVTPSKSKSTSKPKKNTTQIYFENEALNKVFMDYLQMRKTIKKPATENAINLAISKLEKLANSDEEKIKILEQSILNSWQGLFELKNEKGAKKNGLNKSDAGRTNEDALNYWNV